jgi:serine/threonine-protein phosphatase 6 regulatory ankyrin repeat subunit B
MELLVEKGAHLEALDLLSRTPLHYAATRGQAVAVGWLVDKGANLLAANADGETALHAAARHGQVAVLEMVLVAKGAKVGADVDVRGLDGRTPLLVAAEEGQVAVMELLVEEGASIGAVDHAGYTALHYAGTDTLYTIHHTHDTLH